MLRLPRTSALVIVAGAMMSVSLSTPALAQATHDKAWWREIATRTFDVPADVPLPQLLDELTQLLGHTDPELRDDIGYTTLTQWIYVKRIVPVDQRLRLIATWKTNLTSGIGETSNTGVLRRSFSSLALAIMAGLDNEAPFLDRDQFVGLLTSAIAYLRDERDVRGFDSKMGWLHSVAHTADLLKFLGRSQHLQAAEQGAILMAIAEKVSRVETPLVHGEDERLARAVLSIAARPDVDMTEFATFLKAMGPIRRSPPPTMATMAVDQNRRHLLVSIYAVMSADKRELPQVVKAREAVLAVMRTMM